MKVALVGPELEENLALRYIHAALTAAGHEVLICDFHAAAQIPDMAARIVSYDPAVVGLSMVFTARAREYLALAEAIRTSGFSGHITAGGHFAVFHSRELLEQFPALDSILHGEGEQAMQDLLRHLDDPTQVAGMSRRDADGRVARSPQRPQPPDLDDYLPPTRPAKFHQYLGLPIANMLSGRGCYANCRFCSIRAWHANIGGPRFRQRRAGAVAEEMADLYHHRGVRIFNFHDDNFLEPRKADNLDRLAQLQRALQEQGVGRIGFQIKARPDSIDRDVVLRMKEIGLFRVFLGVETNAVAGLITLGRGIRCAQNAESLQVLREAGIHTCFNLLMFDPETTLYDLRENIAFLGRQARSPLNFCRVEVYAGTDIQRQLRAENRLLGDYFGYSYRIRDPRVQCAYEMFRKIFYPRNFALEGMNHRAMQLDYYFHILRHFYPRQATGRLENRVKGLIAELNGNSAAILETICAAVDGTAPLDRAAIDDDANRLAEARADFDRRMDPRMRALLDQIRRGAEHPSTVKNRLLATTASVAAMLMAGAAGVGDEPPETHMHEKAPAPLEPGGQQKLPPDTQPCEMAPAPLPPDTHPTEMAPEPMPPPVSPPAKPGQSTDDWTVQAEMDATLAAAKHATLQTLPAEKLAKVQARFQKCYGAAMLKAAAGQGLLGRKVSVYMDLDAKGQVRGMRIRLLDQKPGEVGKERAVQKGLGALVINWTFPDIGQAGACRMVLEFKHKEPKKPAPPPAPPAEQPDWHMTEMVPSPLDR